MKDFVAIALLALGGGYALLKPSTPDAEPHEPTPPASQASGVEATPAANRVSVELLEPSLDYLTRDGAQWLHGESPYNQNNGCVSCHVVGFAVWGHRAVEARTTTSPSDLKIGSDLRNQEIDALFEEGMAFIAQPGIGRAATWSQMLLARGLRDEATYDWQPTIDALVESQEPDGRWRARGQFPRQRRGELEGDGVATMWALLALDRVDEREETIVDAMTEALAWLTTEAEGQSSEWRAMRLLTERRLGDEDEVRRRLTGIIDHQRADGGWSWLSEETVSEEPQDASDAYSTGVTLYALRRAGLAPDHPSVLGAVRYLLEERLDDGRWLVPSATTSAQASEDRDYIYEYWGTAWAVIGLAEVLPDIEPAPRTAHLSD